MGSSLSRTIFGGAPESGEEGLATRAGDIRLLHLSLCRKGNLPSEVGWLILDYAEYWLSEVTPSDTRYTLPMARARGNNGDVDQRVILSSTAIHGGALEACVRAVVVTIDSRDQGFSSFPEHHGTRNGSSSWFEIMLVRPSSDYASQNSQEMFESAWEPIHRCEVHRNIHASRLFTEKTTSFYAGHPLVDKARKGDKFVLLALAQYPLWMNVTRSCAIEVRTMV
ncbi:hypothetical protein T439DRAFT_327719 [Meredithblackwellia eburnea MCA 4105]